MRPLYCPTHLVHIRCWLSRRSNQPAILPRARTQHEDGKDQSEPAVPDDLPPVVINIEPKVGAKDVDPGLREIRVTFSKKMRDKSWSWTEGNVYSVPKLDGKVHYEYDQPLRHAGQARTWQDLCARDQLRAISELQRHRRTLGVAVPFDLSHQGSELVAGAYLTMMNLKRSQSLIILAGLATCGAVILAAQPTGVAAPMPGESFRGPTASVAEAAPGDPMTSYPFTINPEKVREYPELTVKFRDFHLTSGPVAVVPIDCERGTTGVMIIGNGKFQFAPEKDKAIEGVFRAVMLRFNPVDQPSIISFDKGKKLRDVGATEMSRHMMMTVLRHCYQSTKDGGRRTEVLIPSKGAFAAVLYSKEHGDLLISDAGKEIVAFNFTDRKTLYERK